MRTQPWAATLRVACLIVAAGLLPRPAAAQTTAVGKTVRVTFFDINKDAQRGKLVSISPSEVVIDQSSLHLAVPLADVSKVEKVSHRVRNLVLAGAGIGFVAGYLGSCGTGDEQDCWPEVGAIIAGIGAGTGAIIGWSINRQANRDRRDVLYARSGKQPAIVQFMPVVSLRRAGLGIRVIF